MVVTIILPIWSHSSRDRRQKSFSFYSRACCLRPPVLMLDSSGIKLLLLRKEVFWHWPGVHGATTWKDNMDFKKSFLEIEFKYRNIICFIIRLVPLTRPYTFPRALLIEEQAHASSSNWCEYRIHPFCGYLHEFCQANLIICIVNGFPSGSCEE